MEMRKCKVCGEVKPITDYYKHGDYYDTKCKECAKAYTRKYNAEHNDERKAYKKKYYAENRERIDAEHHKWIDENRDKHNEYTRNWQRRNKEMVYEYTKQYRKNNPDKYKATSRINHLVEKGKLTKPIACEVCGTVGRVEAHHADYSKPLDVMWVCKKCHYKLDEERREKERA